MWIFRVLRIYNQLVRSQRLDAANAIVRIFALVRLRVRRCNDKRFPLKKSYIFYNTIGSKSQNREIFMVDGKDGEDENVGDILSFVGGGFLVCRFRAKQISYCF